MHSRSGFTLKNFHPPLQISNEKTLTTLPSTTFQYLGHGKQSMVFENKEQKVVLKLFYWKRPLQKRWYCHVENWIRFISPTWIYKRIKKKNSLEKLFQRYTWAFEELPEETKILGIHFEKTKQPLLVCLIDRQKNPHCVDLASIPFVLQQKAVLVPEYLQNKKHRQDLRGAIKSLQHLQNLIFSRIDKGFIDKRQVFKNNYGFIDEQPMQIDVGKIKKLENFDHQREKEKIRKNLIKFIQKKLKTLFPTQNLTHEELNFLDSQ